MITIEKNAFLNAIRATKTATGKGNLLPILSSVLIQTIQGGIQLFATDTVVSAMAIVEANIQDEMKVCVNAEKLEAIVSRLDGMIILELNEHILSIKSNNTVFELATMNPEDYPKVQFEMTEDKIYFEKEDFINSINKTIMSTATTQQHILNGVCLTLNNGSYEMAATDGNRLSVVKKEQEGLNKEGQFVIPHDALASIIRLVNSGIEVYFENNKIIFKADNFLYSTPLLSGVYPKYQQLLPKEQPLKALIKRDALLQSLENVAIMSDARTNITTFEFKDNKLYLTTSSEYGKANDIIDIDFEGELKIAFNFKYILEGIKATQSDVIQFQMKDNRSSCLIISDFTYLCMPLSLRNE